MDKDVLDELKSRLNGQSLILEIGFGTGRVLFNILNEIVPKKIIGLESQSKEKIESSYQLFDKEFYSLEKNGKIELFHFYQSLAQNLEIVPLDKNFFNKIVTLNFNTSLAQFTKSNQLRFDLIILYNVLHYSEMGDPYAILKEAINLLKNNRYILISFKNYKHSDEHFDRQEVDTQQVLSVLSTDFKTLLLKDSELENSIIYLGQRIGTNMTDLT